MIQILNKPINDIFFDFIEKSNSNIKLCAPFVKDYTVKNIFKHKQKSAKITLITNFNLFYFYKRSSDIEALDNINQHNGKIFNNQNLHAKFYIFDDAYIIITSANLTFSGLNKNIEYGIFFNEPHLVRQALMDFENISKSKNTGIIRKENIDNIKDMLQSLPKFSKTTTMDDLDDIIEADSKILTQNMNAWRKLTFDVINKINNQQFTLDDVYAFEDNFKAIFPKNNTIRDSIRRNLQELRDLGLIKFYGNGKYKKLWKDR